MNTVYLCSNLNDVKKAASYCVNGACGFLFLQNTEDLSIKSYLSGKENFTHIDKYKIFGDKKDQVLDDVVGFLSQLNAENNSLFWHAFAFTSKNPLDSKLPYRILDFLYFIELISSDIRNSYLSLVVIVDDSVLLQQIKSYLQKKKIRFAAYLKQRKFGFLDILNAVFPLYISIALAKTIFLKAYSYLCLRLKVPRDMEYYVIQSLVSRQSFNSSGYKDTYLGNLPYYLKEAGNPVLIIATVFSPFIKAIKEIKMSRSQIVIIPSQYFCSFLNVFLCYFQAIRKYFFPYNIRSRSSFCINGVSVEIIVRGTTREENRKQLFFSNLLPFYYMRSFARCVKIKRFFYPFENRSWEKSMIAGLKDACPYCQVYGYQHVSISPRLLNYVLDRKEASGYPLPDYLVTIGEKTSRLLKNNFKIGDGRIKIGCALRQEHLFSQKQLKNKPQKIKRILYVLASSEDEYINSLNFCRQAFGLNSDYELYIRPHPTIPFERALKAAATDFRFFIDRGAFLHDSLGKADILFYSSSTVCIEALLLGIPVVYISLPEFIDPDPLFDFSDLKWSVRQPKILLDMLRSIDNISDERFKSLQNMAKEYFLQYFYPVNEENVKIFSES